LINLKSKKGFTLVEIMIVVAIIGLLAAIGIPSFQKAREKSLQTTKKKNANTLANAIAQYAIDQGLSDSDPVQKTDIEPYIGGGWDGLKVGNQPLSFPASTTVQYWRTNVTIIIEDLYNGA
jgi:prepilin-type N-terminal cleavage/methylation domain-containing protein